MKPIFEPGDFGGLAREFWFPEVFEIIQAKLSSLGIDAETIEKAKYVRQAEMDLNEILSAAGDFMMRISFQNTNEHNSEVIRTFNDRLGSVLKRSGVRKFQ